MKFSFNREQLAKTLLFIRNAIPKKEVEPILNMIHFRTATDNQKMMQVVTTDLDLMSVGYVTCEADGAVDVTIPGQRLLSLVAKLTGEKITFDVQDTSVFITCGSYKAEYKTPGTENYPDIYEITQKEEKTEFKREVLLAGFKRIDFAVNQDEAKKQLMAVQISDKGMVASDGKVTAVYREAFTVDELCISSNCLKDLIAVMSASPAENVKVFEEDAYLVFQFGEDLFFTRRTSVSFPDVFGRIDKPTEKNNELLKFKVKDLTKVLQRVSLTASEETRSVVLEFMTTDTMKISARDNKDFYSEETLKYSSENIDISGEEPLKLAFNYDLLLDVLSKMATEDITFKLNIKNIRIPCRVDDGKTTIWLMRSVI